MCSPYFTDSIDDRTSYIAQTSPDIQNTDFVSRLM